MLALRTERLEDMAARALGAPSGAVYGALLQCAESKAPYARNVTRAAPSFTFDANGEPVDNSEVTVADTELVDYLDKRVDLASTIKAGPDEDVAALGIKEEDAEDDFEPSARGMETAKSHQKRVNDISIHLDLLGESSKDFLRRNTRTRKSTVSFAALSSMIAKAEVDSMILARGGQIGLRTCRILRDKGRMQDTQVAGFCLKRLKDVRAILTNLQYLGFVDVQEMPKDNSRQPSKTTYLWFFNEAEVRSTFLQDAYHGILRTLERLDVERETNKDIIEKCESVNWDVKRLNRAEREMLTTWHATEDALSSAVEKLDDVVMVLRDFGETDTSLST